MSHVSDGARAAGMSRATVDRYFENRDAPLLGSSGLLQIGVEVLGPTFENVKQQRLARDDLDPDMLIKWLLRMLWTYLNAPSQAAVR
jgi:AcrR family transcriptional regulator